MWTSLVTVDRLEWTLFGVLIISTIVTGYALFVAHRDRKGVEHTWLLSPSERRLLLPAAKTACIHERFRFTKQFVALIGIFICIVDTSWLRRLLDWLTGESQQTTMDLLAFQGVVLRIVLLLLAIGMLTTTLHSLYARRKYLERRL